MTHHQYRGQRQNQQSFIMKGTHYTWKEFPGTMLEADYF